MVKRTQIVLASWCLCVLAAASAFGQADEAGGEVLFPLAVGSSWTYEPEGGGEAVVETITQKKVIDGQEWYLLKGGQPADPEVKPAEEDLWELWIANVPGGQADADLLVNEQTGEESLDLVRLALPYPAEKGQSYKLTDDPNDDTVMAVLETDERVVTPAGDFDCIVYQEVIPGELTYVFRMYVAPGVGIVKIVTVDGGEMTTDVLREYYLAPAEGE